MITNYNPLVLLSGTSIVLAVTIWPILCYNFVLNSMQLMVTAISLSNGSPPSSATNHDILNPDREQLMATALTFTMFAGVIISEGILVVSLVIQFMSSFDYLTGVGQEYEENWWRCHRKILFLNSIVLTIKLSVSFFFLNYSPIWNDSLIELYAMAINFVYLMIAVNMAVMTVGQRQNQGITPTTTTSHTMRSPATDDNHINLPRSATPSNHHQVINVNSFLDLPPAYGDLEKLPKTPVPETTVGSLSA